MEQHIRKDIAIIIGSVIIAAASLLMIGNLTIDSSTDAFMPKQAPVIEVTTRIEEQFGSLDAIIVGISKDSGTILNPSSLILLKSITDRLGELDAVHRVVSLTNTQHMQSGVDGFEAVPLYSGSDEAQIAQLEARIAEWANVYEGDLISSDHMMASIIVQPDAGTSQHALDNLLDAIQLVIADTGDREEYFSIIGLPAVKQQINRSLLSDMAILGPIVGLLIVLVLLFSFKRFAGIFLPLAGLLISASISLGIMALLDITFTMATMLVPVLLLIVGSAYAIHVMSHFYEEVTHLNRPIESLETARIIGTVVQRNRLPIIMAGATTAAGFIAQFTSPLGPFRTFGLLSAIGVVLSQLSSLYLLPAMLRITYRRGIDPLKIHAERELKREFKGHPVFSLLERISIRGRVPLTIISIILFVATIAALPTIRTGTNMIKFFDPKSRLVTDTERYNTHMSGSGILTVMIEGPGSSAVLDPRFLATLDGFSTEMSQIEGVGKVQTIVPYLKRMNLIMNQDYQPYRQIVAQQSDFDFFDGSFGFSDDLAPEIVENDAARPTEWDPLTYLEIPTDPAKYGLETTDELKQLLSQYLLLYSGNLGVLINDDLEPDATLITIQMTESDTNYLRLMRARIDTYWNEHLDDNWSYSVGGGEAISLALTDLITKSQIYSLVGALVIVWLLVSFIFRSPAAGFVGLIPVVFALMSVFLFMAILHIPLDVITSLLAALAIGIGVDYAIHFIAACKRQGCSSGKISGLGAIMNTTGRAIVINAASVTIGFSGLIFSRFVPIRQMGILFCVAMVFSSLSSLTVLPMVLSWWQPRFLSRPSATETAPTSHKQEIRRISR